MIYLIGGPPKCGKTTLAKALSKEAGVSWISADTLQNIVRIQVPEEDYPKLFPSSNHRTDSNDERFEKYDTQTLIDDYIAQGKTSYSAIEMVVETYLVDEDDFIIEGYQITPELVCRIRERFGSDHIQQLFLYKSDTEKFVVDIHNTTTPNDWIMRRTKKDETYMKIAKMICKYGEYFNEQSQKYSFETMNMDNNFERQLKKAVEKLLSS